MTADNEILGRHSSSTSNTRRVLVLVGGGHAHIQVVLGLSKSVTSSTTCVLVSDSELAAYSGMLPAAVAGLVPEERAHVNLRQLAAHNGFRFVHAAVTGVDATKKEFRFRPNAGSESLECRMRFDILSINVGSRTVSIPDRQAPAWEQIEEMDASSAGAVPMMIETRPILQLMSSVSSFEESMRSQVSRREKVRVVVVGGGAAGIELALAVHTRLAQTIGKVSMTLVSKGNSFASAFGKQAGNAVFAELKKREIGFRFGTTAVATNKRAGLLVLDNSPMMPYDLLIVATGAASHSWLKDATNLSVDEDGWLVVEPTLQCRGHADVFAAGDCISFAGRFGENFPPKAGVYAVREGPILAHNIELALKKDKISVPPFRQFHPQSSFLSLLSTGDGRGIGSKYGLVLKGTWVYRLKNFIDESWQDRFRVTSTPVQSQKLSKSLQETFNGTPIEGAAILQAAEDICGGDSFEQQLLVLQRMDKDIGFRRKLLSHAKKDL